MDGYYEEICPHITTALLNSCNLPKLLGNTNFALSYYRFLKCTLCVKKEMDEKEGKREKTVKVF